MNLAVCEPGYFVKSVVCELVVSYSGCLLTW
jgi:hypothetical protein